MLTDFLLAAFIMAVGLSVAGVSTHLYAWLTPDEAALRYDGRTIFHLFGNLTVSFLCGPYIMLQSGWRQERGGTLSPSSALISALVACGWAFISGLLVVGFYVAARGQV